MTSAVASTRSCASIVINPASARASSVRNPGIPGSIGTALQPRSVTANACDADGRASMAEFYEGKATELPLRDPLTLEPMD